ncbi:MAG: rhomboid family intramembrane serine protease [Marinifilaceae bacterium]|nr:rhomboid family intramembrane serine protease [Marinifilaceae bacterium]
MFYYQGNNGGMPLFSMGLRDIIKSSFRNGSAVTKLIYINIAVYLATKVGLLLAFFMGIAKVEYFRFLNSVLDLPGTLTGLKDTPWSVLTYMFVHYGLLHLLFNMLLLFWAGRGLKGKLSNSVILILYIVGGVIGALAYIFIAPYYEVSTTHLAGASASVMTLLSVRCIWLWRDEAHLPLIGAVKGVYLLLFILGFELLQLMNPLNAGSAVVHIGGALLGVIVGSLLLCCKRVPDSADDKDIHWEGAEEWKAPHRSADSNKGSDTDRVNAILDKVSEEGYENLTPEEKSILFKSGQR